MDRTRRWALLAREYVQSAHRSLRERDIFRNVSAYCMFVGYPRSGHTLVGSLLDAHPEIVIAHELDALRYVRLGFRRSQLYHLILERSRAFTEAGREWTGFDYRVPNGWQGRFRVLRVIGDKKGGESSRWLVERPHLLPRLQRLAGVPVKIIHVTRNPYDNISTMSLRTGAPLTYCSDRFFRLCQGVQTARSLTEDRDFLDIRYEFVVKDPRGSLERLCGLLGVETDAEYLAACAGVVFDSPHRSREKVEWTPNLVEQVAGKMNRYAFLQGYSFEDRGAPSGASTS